MNLERGFRRLTVAVSVVLASALAAIAYFVFARSEYELLRAVVIYGALITALPWALFFTGLWVARGFRREIVAVVPLALLLAGCSLPTMTRADMTAFDRDHYECYREASYPQSSAFALPAAGGGFIAAGGSGPTYPPHSRIGQELYRLCMKARGYREAG